tara:strand:+ start:547 stop:2610 length:2064 start_codon:yes stop_codon:yes gene_type:complete
VAETRAPIVFSFKGFDQLDNAIKKLQTLKTLVNDVNKVGGAKTGAKAGGGDRTRQLTAQSNALNQIEKTRDRINQLDVKGTRLAAIKGRLTRAENAVKKGDLPLARQILAASEKRITILSRESKINKDNTRELERQRKSIEQATRSIRRRKIADKRRTIEESPGFRFAQFRRNRTASDRRIRRDTLSSAAIGGAFPLLFGQGAGASAGGALGGFAGGILGGQAGFALSLIGTQLGSIIDTFVSGAAELGRALGPFAQDTQAVTAALGLQGSAEESRLRLIEQTQGKTAAFNASMRLMATEIGQRGVNSLKQFGENTRLLTSSFVLAITKLQAFTAGIVNFVARITGLQGSLEAGAATRTVAAAAGEGNAEAQALVDRRKAAESMKSRGGEGRRRKVLLDEISAEEKIFAIRRNTSIEVDNLTQKFDALGVSIKAEAEETKRIAELRKQGLNPALARSIAGIEKEGQLAKDSLQVEIDKIKQKIITTGELTEKDQIRLEELVKGKQTIDGQVDSLSEAATATDKLNDSTKDLKSNFEKIGESIASGVTDNITAAIQGTKSLGDAAKSILNDISSTLIKLGVNTLLSSIPGFGGLPNLLGGRARGGPVTKNGSFVVGEKGPELFVPKRSGTIIPNDKLGGGSTNISVNVDASGSSVQGDEQQSKELGRVISVAIQSELLKQRRPGGLLR